VSFQIIWGIFFGTAPAEQLAAVGDELRPGREAQDIGSMVPSYDVVYVLEERFG
jgi:hypothetical protein